tara:strand:+ start:42 stop:278 length:237 start_codon:yes stop_codon:yes gene_type:complete
MWIKSFIEELTKIASGNEFVYPNDMRDGAPEMPGPNITANVETKIGPKTDKKLNETKPTGWSETQTAQAVQKPEPMKV